MTKSDITAALDGQRGQDLLLNAPEISIWMTAYGCLRQIGDIQQAYSDRKVGEKDYYSSVSQMLVELAETADATHRFGVLLPATIEPHYKRRLRCLDDSFLKVEFSPSFWRWYNWWDDYMKQQKPTTRTHLFRLVMERLPDVDRFRPEGDWLNYREEAALRLFTV